MSVHELLPSVLAFTGWVLGALSKPVGTRIGHAIRARRLGIHVPLRVRLLARAADLAHHARKGHR